MSSCNCTGQCRKTGSCSSGVTYTHPAKTRNNQKMIDVLMELSKYRLLSKDEIEELTILRKANEK